LRRSVVLVSMVIILVGLTIWVTSLDKVGINTMSTPGELLKYLADHLVMVLWAMFIAIPVGVILGVILTRPGFYRVSNIVMGIVSMGQAMPSLALIAIIAILPLTIGAITFGFNYQTVIIALVVYGLMPMLRNSYTGIYNIDRAVIESAEGMGMTRLQIFYKIELPMALPVIITGIRISATLTIGTAVLAPLVGGPGLGIPTFRGVTAGEPLLILQGAAPTAILAIVFGFVLETIEKFMTPRGLRIQSEKSRREVIPSKKLSGKEGLSLN